MLYDNKLMFSSSAAQQTLIYSLVLNTVKMIADNLWCTNTNNRLNCFPVSVWVGSFAIQHHHVQNTFTFSHFTIVLKPWSGGAIIRQDLSSLSEGDGASIVGRSDEAELNLFPFLPVNSSREALMLAAEWEIKAGERKSRRDKWLLERCRKWRERKRDEKERERAALAAVQSDGEVELQEAPLLLQHWDVYRLRSATLHVFMFKYVQHLFWFRFIYSLKSVNAAAEASWEKIWADKKRWSSSGSQQWVPDGGFSFALSFVSQATHRAF